jgi:damage-control phosphatase, subfamily I
MKMQFNCVTDCQMTMMLSIMKAHSIPAKVQLELLSDYIATVAQYEPEINVGIAFSEMYINLRKKLGINDFYMAIKHRQNDQAQALLPLARRLIEQEADDLLAALKISSSGNIIDVSFGEEFDVEGSLRESMYKGFAINDYPRFVENLSHINDLVLAADNAGEIAFDRLLVEQMHRWRTEQGLPPLDVTVLVKGGPVLNDATRIDAEAVGFQHIARIMDTGCEYIGLPPSQLSGEALETLDHAGIILSKGIANYESASIERRFSDHIFYLFKAKCRLVWNDLNVPAQSIIFLAGDRTK